MDKANKDEVLSETFSTGSAAKTVGMRIPLEQYHVLLKHVMDNKITMSDYIYYKVFLEDKKIDSLKKQVQELENNLKLSNDNLKIKSDELLNRNKKSESTENKIKELQSQKNELVTRINNAIEFENGKSFTSEKMLSILQTNTKPVAPVKKSVSTPVNK